MNDLTDVVPGEIIALGAATSNEDIRGIYEQPDGKRTYHYVHKMRNGDVFTIDSKRFLEVFSMSNREHGFIPLTMPYKKVVWYKPSTWLKKFIKVKYVEWR